jgi:ParB-like chromosome segregation protein Spo0J
VGREFDDVRERVKGYLPVVQIRGERGDRPDRMASTIRHNRARGKHQVIKMSEIVLELKRRNWSDAKVAKELGMDPDEVLRLTQITGLAEAFADGSSPRRGRRSSAGRKTTSTTRRSRTGLDGGITDTELADA